MRKPMTTWTHLRTVSIPAYPYAAQTDLHRLLQNPARFSGGDADQPQEKEGGDHHEGSFATGSFFMGGLVHAGSLIVLEFLDPRGDFLFQRVGVSGIVVQDIF